MPSLQLWGGIECTINRVGNRWTSQLQRTGHGARLADLDRIAALGLKVLRYPALWEQAAPERPGLFDWSWADERLTRARELGIELIVGLLHHGSGPGYTSLISPQFAAGLARYAAAFAARFPWIAHYTPVNEPLTTARFSGLYGLWYPHGRDDRTFVRALLNQCRATCLAMEAIRQINPAAELIQTEDLGTTYSTPRLRYQADFDNERRWLTWDLLCGRVDERHPLRGFLREHGATAAELDAFVARPCPPSTVGINHYVTSDRFLDEKLTHYPAVAHGGNRRERYADVDAVRVLRGAYRGWSILEQAWQRYRLPIAVTEVHLGCTREEQLRWLRDAWNAALDARARGSDIRAVTTWALFGSCDWSSLLTRERGHYEPGAFDIRAPTPRATALAELIRTLARDGGSEGHPCARGLRGWWERAERLHYAPDRTGSDRNVIELRACATPRSVRSRQPLLICGRGTLGGAVARACEERGLEFRLLGRRDLDIADPQQVDAVLAQLEPWAIVNAAAFNRVDEAEREPARCYRENVLGATNVARAAQRRGLRLLAFSSNFVFDGCASAPYRESSAVRPLNVYGRSQAAAETAIHATLPDALCVRTAALFGCWETADFLLDALAAVDRGDVRPALDDTVISPSYLPDVVHAALDLLIDGAHGIWHLANRGSVSRAEFARRGTALAGLDPRQIDTRSAGSLTLRAPRPRFSPLGSERGDLLPSLEDALERFAVIARERWLPERRRRALLAPRCAPPGNG